MTTSDAERTVANQLAELAERVQAAAFEQTEVLLAQTTHENAMEVAPLAEHLWNIAFILRREASASAARPLLPVVPMMEDWSAGMSLRECAKKYRTTLGRVRGIALRARTTQEATHDNK